MKWLEVAPLLVAASRLLTGHRAKSLAVLLIFDNVLVGILALHELGAKCLLTSLGYVANQLTNYRIC